MKKLNFGCGNDIKKGWDNVDIQQGKKLLKNFDFNKFPYPIKENSYDYILLKNVLEHLEEPNNIIEELRRICKKEGIIEIIVPHYTNKGAYSDMGHKHFFNEIAFKQLEEQKTIINKFKKFEIQKLELIPTSIGKFFPRVLREKLSLLINGLISQIHVKLKVVK